MVPRGDAATAWKWAGVTGPFKIGLGAERAGLHTRCNESPAIMRAKRVAGKRLPDQAPAVGLPGSRAPASRLAALPSSRVAPLRAPPPPCPPGADDPLPDPAPYCRGL